MDEPHAYTICSHHAESAVIRALIWVGSGTTHSMTLEPDDDDPVSEDHGGSESRGGLARRGQLAPLQRANEPASIATFVQSEVV